MTEAIEAWREYHNRIEQLIEEEGFENFLQWYPIRRAVWVGNAPHIREKLKWIIKSYTSLSLFAKLEMLNEKWIGNPDPLPDADYTSGTRVNMVYHILQLKKHVGIYFRNFDFIFEFGGGYGCFADIMYRLGFSGDYWFYDVPAMLRIQDYFMQESGHKKHKMRFIPNVANLDIPKISNSAFVATMSFAEISIEERAKIEEHLHKFKLIFIAFAEDFGHGNIDNRKYFDDFKKRFDDYEWKEWLIDGDLKSKRPGKFYLVGDRKE